MRTLSRVLAYGLGMVVLAFVVVLALAGVPAAAALLLTAAAVLAMIALGGLVGGRSGTPRPGARGGSGTGPADQGGTMGR